MTSSARPLNIELEGDVLEVEGDARSWDARQSLRPQASVLAFTARKRQVLSVVNGTNVASGGGPCLTLASPSRSKSQWLSCMSWLEEGSPCDAQHPSSWLASCWRPLSRCCISTLPAFIVSSLSCLSGRKGPSPTRTAVQQRHLSSNRA
jgi:hypothetical protein